MAEIKLNNIHRIRTEERIFHNAIVRLPCPEMKNGLSRLNAGKPDFHKALQQHKRYVEALKYCGLSVTILEADNRFPDSTFIEDVAICTRRCAIITNPGAPSRNGEISGMKKVLQKHYTNIEEINQPGTLDGGDVMMISDHYYIGISTRTNHSGADQLIRILETYGFSGSKVRMKLLLHLKSGASYLENRNLLLSHEIARRKEFAEFSRILVDIEESYAANSVWINGIVIVPEGYPKTRKKIEKAGYETIAIDVSEFRKLDGGVSCLSLRFGT